MPLITDSTQIFLVVLLIILVAPLILRPLRIPHILGMILAGVVIGPYGFGLIDRDQSFEIFGQVGLYYIMFLAALEMDTRSLFKDARKHLFFGLLTFLIPFIIAYFGSRLLLGFSSMQSLLVGCILSSNTLIAYPIITRYGLGKRKSVSFSVGGTMIALLLSLIIVAAVSNLWNSSGTSGILWFVVKLILYGVASILIIPRITRGFLRTYSDPVSQFIFVLGVMMLSAAAAELCGIEGILGAFLSGQIMSRYVPKISPLMNRLEFVGNAIFIPYFLIGVGMMINIASLWTSLVTINVVIFMVVAGTLGKAIAGYVGAWGLKKSVRAGELMFGLTSAHAAGAIAMIIVGTKLEIAPGVFLMNNDILNGVVVMILFSCIISSVVTENAARKIVMNDNILDLNDESTESIGDDEKILIPIKNEQKAETLIHLAALMRNGKLNRGLVALNVVLDGNGSVEKQREGRQVLERLTRVAASLNIRMQTQSRLATNVANGIAHAFVEYDASEIIVGAHSEAESGTYGTILETLFANLNRQIVMARIIQPLNTIRKIQVVVPEEAHYEPGFYRWVERLARVAENLSCRIVFHGKEQALDMIKRYLLAKHEDVVAEYQELMAWDKMKEFADNMSKDHLLVIVIGRKGTVSYHSRFEKVPMLMKTDFKHKNVMIVLPDQYGQPMNEMTFTAPSEGNVPAISLLKRLFKKQ